MNPVRLFYWIAMAVQTYCVRADIEDIFGTAGVKAHIDDDHSGGESSAETTVVTKVIERAAVRMNQVLDQRYILSELATNDWCKYANATIAVYMLMTRRGNPAPQDVEREFRETMEFLDDVRLGIAKIPQANESFETIPTVSNFEPERGRRSAPIRVATEESTGTAPAGGRKRRTARRHRFGFDFN